MKQKSHQAYLVYLMTAVITMRDGSNVGGFELLNNLFNSCITLFPYFLNNIQ